MSSQLDLDQGGTDREWERVYRGHGVGYIWMPKRNLFPITAAGTFNLFNSTSLVEVNVAGAVTIVLPTALTPAAGPQARPGDFARNPITIVDVGGHALANPITIQAFGSENIVGLASIQITSNYGAFTLNPSNSQQGWNIISP